MRLCEYTSVLFLVFGVRRISKSVVSGHHFPILRLNVFLPGRRHCITRRFPATQRTS